MMCVGGLVSDIPKIFVILECSEMFPMPFFFI